MKTSIIAETLDEFKICQESLSNLPEAVRDQIESAKYCKHLGLRCVISNTKITHNTLHVFLPKDVLNIRTNNEKISICYRQYFFEININEKINIHYEFV